MNLNRFFSTAALAGVVLCAVVHGQVVLSGTSYSQNFSTLGSGLPTGWTVHTSTTASTLGTTAAFTTTATTWNSTTGVFRNISSNNILSSDGAATQAANTNRALGFRPNDASSREGAVMVSILNTTGYENFSVSVSLFTGNDVTNTQTYSFEYRVGNSGSFTSIDTYTTGSLFSSTTLTASSITLTAVSNQSDPVYFRIRGTSTAGTGNLDTLGIDNFAINFSASAIPEPSTYAVFAALACLSSAVFLRRSRVRNANRENHS